MGGGPAAAGLGGQGDPLVENVMAALGGLGAALLDNELIEAVGLQAGGEEEEWEEWGEGEGGDEAQAALLQQVAELHDVIGGAMNLNGAQ